MTGFTYLDFLLYFFAFPIVAMFFFARRDYIAAKKTVVWIILLTLFWGTVCDMIAVRTGLWTYRTGRPTLGAWFFDLPLEEFLFYVLFPLLALSVFFLWRFVFRIFFRGGRA
jgi:lycopene cyclase domain-containing protein